MKNIQQFILKACGLSVLITTIFYLFAFAIDVQNASMPFIKFMLILFFSFITSGTKIICSKLKFNKIIKELIQYSVLLIIFCLIFISTGELPSGTFTKIFTSIALFTLLYVLLQCLLMLINRIANKGNKVIEKHIKQSDETEKVKYKSLYK